MAPAVCVYRGHPNDLLRLELPNLLSLHESQDGVNGTLAAHVDGLLRLPPREEV